MKMPLLTPSGFEYVEGIDSDIDLFNVLTQNLNKSISFFESAIEDQTWSYQHIEFVKLFTKWLTNLYFFGRLTDEGALKVKKMLINQKDWIYPHIIRDFEFEIENEKTAVNSLIMGTSSRYLASIIRNAAENNFHKAKLENIDPLVADALFHGIENEYEHFPNMGFDMLTQMAIKARVWELEEGYLEAEKLMGRYLTPENALDNVLLAEKEGLTIFKDLACHYYSNLAYGFSLNSNEGKLMAIFNDFKTLTTLEQYKKIAPFITDIKIKGSLAQEEGFDEVIKLTPKCRGIDLGESLVPPYWDKIPANIERLNIHRVEWLTENILEEIAHRFSKLNSLDLADNTYLGFQELNVLNQFKLLTQLSLSGCNQIGDTELLIALNSQENLQRLFLRGLNRVTSTGLQKALQSFQGLVDINVSFTSADDSFLSLLLNNNPRLRRVNVDNTEVSSIFLESVKKKRPLIHFEYPF